MGGLPAEDRNNVIYVPLRAAMLRIEDPQSFRKDEIDAVYLSLAADGDIGLAGAAVRGLLEASHRGAGDFSVIVPAELLADVRARPEAYTPWFRLVVERVLSL